MTKPETYMQAPNFSLQDQENNAVSLPEKGIVVLFFYPKADTPGCTIEAKKFTDLYPQFIDAGALVFGLSPDPHKNICAFAEKQELGIPLLADEDHSVAEQYGVWQRKKFMGKEYMGIVRTTFLIVDGQIKQQWAHKPGKTEQEVLDAIIALE